jgi:hypothetical protein
MFTFTVNVKNDHGADSKEFSVYIAPMGYNVTYNSNGGTGTVPTERDHSEGETFKAASASALTAPINKKFAEWNTKADGTGIGYVPGSTVTMPAEALVLYAIWGDVMYKVSYDGNEGTGIAPDDLYKAVGAKFNAMSNMFTAPANMKFVEWNTKADGTGISYDEEDEITMLASDLILFAIWEDMQYNVSYDANEGTGMAPADIQMKAGTEFNTAMNMFTAPVCMKFIGWNTKADGTGTSYSEGQEVTMGSSDLILYAMWEDILYKVSYDLNGGTGMVPEDIFKANNETFLIAPADGMSAPEGKKFVEWNTNADGTGVGYAPGDDGTMVMEGLTLYAIWGADDPAEGDTGSKADDGNAAGGSGILWILVPLIIGLAAILLSGSKDNDDDE